MQPRARSVHVRADVPALQTFVVGNRADSEVEIFA